MLHHGQHLERGGIDRNDQRNQQQGRASFGRCGAGAIKRVGSHEQRERSQGRGGLGAGIGAAGHHGRQDRQRCGSIGRGRCQGRFRAVQGRRAGGKGRGGGAEERRGIGIQGGHGGEQRRGCGGQRPKRPRCRQHRNLQHPELHRGVPRPVLPLRQPNRAFGRLMVKHRHMDGGQVHMDSHPRHPLPGQGQGEPLHLHAQRDWHLHHWQHWGAGREGRHGRNRRGRRFPDNHNLQERGHHDRDHQGRERHQDRHDYRWQGRRGCRHRSSRESNGGGERSSVQG